MQISAYLLEYPFAERLYPRTLEVISHVLGSASDPGRRRRGVPTAHYVMIDDKPHLLAEMKQVLGDTLTTVFVRQEHYAIAGNAGIRLAPDRDIVCIGELRHCVLAYFLLAAAVPESNETNRTMEQA